MIAIIDYDAGNIKSVEKALQYLGEEAVITRDREEILASDKVILPGVGAFGDAMEKLEGFIKRRTEYVLGNNHRNALKGMFDAAAPFYKKQEKSSKTSASGGNTRKVRSQTNGSM